MNTPENPPCANWKIWTGPEVEGHTDLGKKTLFVREGLHFPMYITADIQRIWFCKEILDTLVNPVGMSILHGLRKQFQRLPFAFEVPLQDIDMYPPLRKFGSFYVKFDLDGYLQQGDTLCFGAPYNDRFLVVPTTENKVSPSCYKNDTCLEA